MPEEPRYSKEEVARRGDEIYKSQFKPHLKPSDKGKILVIDVHTGAYEISESEDAMEATRRLRERYPDAQIWGIRVGYVAVRSIGVRIPEEP
jgi:hypothetical protein